MNFIDKGTLAIETGAGNNTIDINDATAPTGLTGITVNGLSPTGNSSLIVNGTTAADAITYTPTGPGAGTVAFAAVLPKVTFSGVASLEINGQGGSDSLTVVAPGDQVTVIPGIRRRFRHGGHHVRRRRPVSFTPLTFSNLGQLPVVPGGTGSALTISGATTPGLRRHDRQRHVHRHRPATAGDGTVAL